MIDFALVICVMEVAVFFWLLSWQKKNRRNSCDVLKEIESKLKTFEVITPSDVTINQFDRMVEFPLDKIRSFSNGALVFGIGGTMGLFLLETVSIGWTAIFADVVEDALLEDLPKILLGLLLALFSSLWGIRSHLGIAKILSTAHDKVSTKETELLTTQAPSPETKLSKQLEELTRAWDESDPADLFKLIPKFLQGQTAVIQSMEDSFQKYQTTALEVMESQRTFTQKGGETLSMLCDNVSEFSASTKIIEESYKSLRNEVSDSLERLIQEQESLKKELEWLPQNIRGSLEGIDELFGKKVEQSVLNLERALEEKISQLTDILSENQRRQSEKLFEVNDKLVNSFANLKIEVENKVVHPLRKVADQLDETTSIIPEIGQDLRNSAQALSGIPEKLEEAGKGINEVVRSTASKALTPVSEKMNNYIETVAETHANLEKIIQNLVSLIRNTIRSIEGKK